MTYLTKEAAQSVLDALEDACGGRCNAEYNPCWQRQAIAIMQSAIDAPEQEPIAEVCSGPDGNGWFIQYFKPKQLMPVGTKLYTAPPAPQAPAPTVRDNMQDWKGMPGTTAYQLIDRHADNWSDIGKMMGEWLAANQTAPQAPQDLNELAKVYASSYASPHHITFTLDGLRNLLAVRSEP